MNDEHEAQTESGRPQGIIACLTLGFEIVAHNPQLALLPIIIDLYLWMGPRLSLASLLEPLQEMWSTAPTVELAPVYQTLNQMLEETAQRFNLFSFLNPLPLVGVPSLMSQQWNLEHLLGLRATLPVPNAGIALGWAVVLTLVGLGLGALYLWQIGLRVRDDTNAAVPGPMRPGRLWGHLIRLMGLIIGAALLIIGPVVTLSSLLGMLSLGLAGLVITLFLSIVLFFLFHCLYVVPSIVQLEQSPVRALRESFILTRVDFLGTAGFVLVFVVLTQGLNLVWMLPEPSSWATLVGIVGHALVSTALMAALFVFYQERLAYLEVLKRTYAANQAQSPVDT